MYAQPRSLSSLSRAGVGAVVHPSSEGGQGHKGAEGEDLGSESELGKRTPQYTLGTLQRPCVHPTPLAISASLPAQVLAPLLSPSRLEAVKCPQHPLPFSPHQNHPGFLVALPPNTSPSQPFSLLLLVPLAPHCTLLPQKP